MLEDFDLNHPPCSQQPSALPYIGAYLDQIYSLEMNSKTCNPVDLGSFTKMTKINITQIRC